MGKQLKLVRKPAWVALSAFDRQVLAHHTMDDAGLAGEILALFLGQLDRLYKVAWRDLDLAFEMHTLRGSAAAVGALQIEALAGGWRGHGEALETEVKAAIRAFRKAIKA